MWRKTNDNRYFINTDPEWIYRRIQLKTWALRYRKSIHRVNLMDYGIGNKRFKLMKLNKKNEFKSQDVIAKSESVKNIFREQFIRIPDNIVLIMKKLREENTSISIMMLFGIGDNTWRRIRMGEPIRKSVASRLLLKIESIIK